MTKQGPEQAATLRRLKWLGVCLVCSNFVLGGLGAYMLRSADNSFTQLLGDSVPLMNEVRNMGKEGGLAFRGVIEAFVAADASTTAAAVKRARDAMEQERRIRLKIEGKFLLKNNPELIAQLDLAAAEFRSLADDMLGRVKFNSSADAEHDAILQLSQSTDRYSNAVQEVADFVESQTASISDGYTKTIRNRSVFVIGLAGWPLLVAGVVILVTVSVVILMLFVFRRETA